MKSKGIALALVLLLAISTNTVPKASAAVPKSGQKCNKLGLTQTFEGKKFTCIKSGKKYVWNKGVQLKPIPIPSPSKSNVVAEIVSAEKAEPNFGCSKNNETAFTLQGAVICKNSLWQIVPISEDSIESRAFRYVIEHWNSQPAGNLTIDFYIDQNAGTWVNEIELGLRTGARFWGTSAPGSKPIPAFISDDPVFIEESLAKAGIVQSVEDKLRNRNARGGQAGFHGGDPMYWDFLFKNAQNRSNVGYFQVGPHEYTHFAQFKLVGSGNWGEAGPWFNEGLASFIGSALGPMCKMPHNQMDGWRENLNSYSTSKLIFFNESKPEVYGSPNWGDVYPLGAMATQALVALVGIDSIYSLYRDLGANVGRDAAFKKNFKLESRPLANFLQEYIDSIYLNKEWSLPTLEEKYKVAIANNP